MNFCYLIFDDTWVFAWAGVQRDMLISGSTDLK